MRNKIFIFCAAAAMLVALTVPVFAHPGRTDSNGGHTDHSTGEYHYHHGYSAHDHYDMDGDGDKDCPYDFDDKTGSSSGSSSNFKVSTPTQKTETIVKTVTEEVPYIPGWVFVVFAITGIAVIILSGALYDEKQANKFLRKTIEENKDKIKTLETQNNKLKRRVGEKCQGQHPEAEQSAKSPRW